MLNSEVRLQWHGDDLASRRLSATTSLNERVRQREIRQIERDAIEEDVLTSEQRAEPTGRT
jgi:hypothetical protein